jgi:hypothetical protein
MLFASGFASSIGHNYFQARVLIGGRLWENYFKMTLRFLPEQPDAAVVRILAQRGLPSKIARACGITPQGIYKWKRVPIHWVHIVASVSGMTPEQVRPDIFKPRKARR